MNDAQAAALIAAGRLLQSKTWSGGRMRIEPTAGQAYPQAVARVIETLDDGDRDRLRELVAWVLDYDRHDSGRRQAEQAEGRPPEDPAFDLPAPTGREG